MVAGVTHKALITWPLFSLILVSVSFSSLAQISLKQGEALTLAKVAGTLLVVFGVWLVAAG
jgi:hypothetical protein